MISTAKEMLLNLGVSERCTLHFEIQCSPIRLSKVLATRHVGKTVGKPPGLDVTGGNINWNQFNMDSCAIFMSSFFTKAENI